MHGRDLVQGTTSNANTDMWNLSYTVGLSEDRIKYNF